MDSRLLEQQIRSHQPFTIVTASGDRYRVPSPDFIHFSPSRTAVFVFWTDDAGDNFAIIPLLTISSVEAKVDAA